MKVLVFTTVFPNPAQPLQGLFVRERARHAARLAEVRVVAPVAWFRRKAAIPRRTSCDGLAVEHPTFFYVPRFFKRLDGLLLFLSALPRVARLRREFDFDLIDAHFVFPDGFAAVLLGRWFRRPVTITERGTLVPLSLEPARLRASRRAFLRADRVIAVAGSLARRVADLGVPADRIEVIPNGVDAARIAPQDRAEARARLGLPATGKLLVSVGRLSHEKAFHRVLNVLPDLLRDHPDLKYVIVGGAEPGGEYERRLRRLVADLGLAGHADLVGSRAPDEVLAWINAADVFVLPSDYEGSPNVVWEALACGRPVVATRVGEVERMVPSYGGLLFDPGEPDEALRRCLHEALRRDWDGGRMRAHAERHTWEQVAYRVLEQWRLAIEARARSSRPPQGAAPEIVEPLNLDIAASSRRVS